MLFQRSGTRRNLGRKQDSEYVLLYIPELGAKKAGMVTGERACEGLSPVGRFRTSPRLRRKFTFHVAPGDRCRGRAAVYFFGFVSYMVKRT